MFPFLAFFCIIVATPSQSAFYEESALKNIARINNRLRGYKAGYNDYFRGKSLADIKILMGAKLDKDPRSVAPEKIFDSLNTSKLPKTFVAGKDKWSKCGSTVNFIKDQANCGSCWAVASSEVVASRICIANYASLEASAVLPEPRPAVDMSLEELLSCCNWCGTGCGGGYIIDAMRYWTYMGVVTGGWYGSKCGCQPYAIKPCPPAGCTGGEAHTPKCSKTCIQGYPRSYKEDKHFASKPYTLPNNAQALQQEIHEAGPIACEFSVHESFLHYKDGVYDKPTGSYLGGHAVALVGWGEENGKPYWLINNSWNTTWGINGQFKFLRGSNLSGMESRCVAGAAKPNDNNYLLKCV